MNVIRIFLRLPKTFFPDCCEPRQFQMPIQFQIFHPLKKGEAKESRGWDAYQPNKQQGEAQQKWVTCDKHGTQKQEKRRLYLNHRVTSCGSLDGPSAALSLIVGPVMGLGLHLDPQLIRAWLVAERPLKWRKGCCYWDAEGRKEARIS
jgi:hypothetical protein